MAPGIESIQHIVVLMMENRSYDHMLGYLTLAGRTDLDGLNGRQSNPYNGKSYSPGKLTDLSFKPDPCHDWDSVAEQLSNRNTGFIQNYAKCHAGNPERIMNYYDASQLYAIDHLAREYAVCDRWFSALPTETQPNRVYALAGQSAGKIKNYANPIGKWDIPTVFDVLPEGVTWSYYKGDLAFLRVFHKYAYDRIHIKGMNDFFAAAAAGTLPNVSWIDPHYGIFFPWDANDDHPPHPIDGGQDLIRRIYNALLSGGQQLWDKTLFLVTYDEHGGFYDHADTTVYHPPDKDFAVYGVRVPALIVSPWVPRQSAYGTNIHKQPAGTWMFDHTSIPRTILERFAPTRIDALTPRVAAANSVWPALSEHSPRTDCTPIRGVARPRLAPDNLRPGMIGPVALSADNQLQRELRAMAAEAMAAGIPPEDL